MVLLLHCYRFQQHFVGNYAPVSFNLHIHAFKIIQFGRANNFGKVLSIKMFKHRSKHYICHEQIQQRLPQLLTIVIRIHELDLVHQIQGELTKISVPFFISLRLLQF